tara:strand:+ start:1225 stop:1470 length:246 start_codon:yes stop_codon:yes gene_type:complete
MDITRFKEYQQEIARLRQKDTDTTNRVRATYNVKQDQLDLEQQADLQLTTDRREMLEGLQVLAKLDKNNPVKKWVDKVAKK